MSQNPFKPGDRVRCKTTPLDGPLRVGNAYTVDDWRGRRCGAPEFVYIVELPERGGYLPERFELVTEPEPEPEYDWVKVEKVGDLKCGDVVRLNGAEFEVGSVSNPTVDFFSSGLAFTTFQQNIPFPGLEVRREKPLPLPTEPGIPFWGKAGDYEGLLFSFSDSIDIAFRTASGVGRVWFGPESVTRLPWPEGELEKFKEKIK